MDAKGGGTIILRKLSDGRVVITKPEGASLALTPEQVDEVVKLLQENK